MIYKLHYWFYASGANVFSILIGVFIETYTDASPSELGILLMAIPFLSIIFRPIICSIADRKQAHRKYMIICLLVLAISYSPFVVIPLLGERVYREHARLCWYMFMILKIIGDVASGGVMSIGDSLAINYAKRIGTSFTVYRVWATISWMFFGLVIGQVNEIWFLPKFVPGFIILISASLLNSFCIWLWPAEYFEMTSTAPEAHVQKTEEPRVEEKCNAFTKSLMPKEIVWAQAKQKLFRVFCLGSDKESTETSTGSHKLVEEAKRQRKREIDKLKEKSREISVQTQARILLVLFRRDARIICYLFLFMFAGVVICSTLSFFYINLSNVCHNQGACDFSQLAGLLQVSMASLETVMFIYVGRIIAKIGRINLATIAILLAGLKFTFYGTIWNHMSPYYALLSESASGVMFGIILTLMIETGHMFASEVQHIIPELLERQIISVETDTTKLRYSLAATMQAIISSSFDGFGKGLGALAIGVLLERISFDTLWLLIGLSCFALFFVMLALNLIVTGLNLNLGLDAKEAEKSREVELSSLDKV